jgi:hypothetical protein
MVGNIVQGIVWRQLKEGFGSSGRRVGYRQKVNFQYQRISENSTINDNINHRPCFSHFIVPVYQRFQMAPTSTADHVILTILPNGKERSLPHYIAVLSYTNGLNGWFRYWESQDQWVTMCSRLSSGLISLQHFMDVFMQVYLQPLVVFICFR